MPDWVPALSSLLGITDVLFDKSIVTVMFVPALKPVLSSSVALALMVVRAKRSVLGGSGGHIGHCAPCWQPEEAILHCHVLRPFGLVDLVGISEQHRERNTTLSCGFSTVLLFSLEKVIIKSDSMFFRSSPKLR